MIKCLRLLHFVTRWNSYLHIKDRFSVFCNVVNRFRLVVVKIFRLIYKIGWQVSPSENSRGYYVEFESSRCLTYKTFILFGWSFHFSQAVPCVSPYLASFFRWRAQGGLTIVGWSSIHLLHVGAINADKVNPLSASSLCQWLENSHIRFDEAGTG